MNRRLHFAEAFQHARRSAYLDGFSLHAGVRVHEHDREGLERLCRYAARPPIALHRLSEGEGGKLVYRMKRPRGGSRFLLLTPDELVARLATLVPPPRSHALRYHGVFAPNSRVRARVVPARPQSPEAEPAPCHPAPCHPREPHPAGPPGPPAPALRPAERPPAPRSQDPGPRTRVPWAELLQKVFAIDVLECPRCAGRLEVVAYIAQPSVAKQILDHLGLESQAPPVAKARSIEASEPEPGSEYDCVDPSPSYDE